MGHFLSHLSLLLLLVAISHAAELTGRDYWKSVLPKTPMPNAITALLDSGKQNSGKQFPGPIRVSCKFRSYKQPPSESQLNNNPQVDLFFLQKDLYLGKKIALHFTKTTTNTPSFIPRSEANNIPFSSAKFSEILDYFKIAKDSPDADALKETINDCEKTDVTEEKYCATSLESMVDFAMSSLKTNYVRSLSSNINNPNAQKQEYTIIKSKTMAQSGLVTCHMEPYAYAVFYCHVDKSSEAYMVNLVGKDGARVAAVAVCHMDTSSWNPKHLAFQVLKVQPGTVPVCHFLSTDDVIWTHAM